MLSIMFLENRIFSWMHNKLLPLALVLALTDGGSGVLICIIVRTNKRQSESQTLKQENENEKHWHGISQQNKKHAEKSYSTDIFH